ncbi:MAG: ATP-binding protein [Giesbergeria sp.]
MDGFKKRLNASLQLKLSVALSLTILLVAVVAGMFSFATAFKQAHDLQDVTLQQVATLFDRQHLVASLPQNDHLAQSNYQESRVVVQFLAEGARAVGKGHTGAVLALPLPLPDGLQTVDVEGESFRVMVKTTPLGERIAVAQETDVRDDIAEVSALHTLMPFLILVPILLLLVADLVRKMFRPIAELSAAIDERVEEDLQPIAKDDLPIEVRPFAAAINRLLRRVDKAMQGQRRFVADAAHELRSPLTALSLQAGRLAEAPMSDLAHARLDGLRQGIERGSRLLEQLLNLAKAQAAPELPPSAVSVQHLFRTVLEDCLPLAEARDIDIGVAGAEDALVWANELDLEVVLKNLVDNAIRYTPEGGKIDLSVSKEIGFATLQIQDSGPGIAEAERERVFDAFYRTPGSQAPGSGLGLSIVRSLLQRMGAEIGLGFVDETHRCGLRVTIRMPTGSPLSN